MPRELEPEQVDRAHHHVVQSNREAPKRRQHGTRTAQAADNRAVRRCRSGASPRAQITSHYQRERDLTTHPLHGTPAKRYRYCNTHRRQPNPAPRNVPAGISSQTPGQTPHPSQTASATYPPQHEPSDGMLPGPHRRACGERAARRPHRPTGRPRWTRGERWRGQRQQPSGPARTW